MSNGRLDKSKLDEKGQKTKDRTKRQDKKTGQKTGQTDKKQKATYKTAAELAVKKLIQYIRSMVDD